jgi:cytochrome c peroxidase
MLLSKLGPLSCLLLLPSQGCFSEPNPDEGGSAEDATTSDAGDAESTSGGDGTDASAGSDDASGGSDETGATADYPDDVLDVLDLPFPPDNYADPDLPAHFLVPAVVAQDNTPGDNAITDEGATLGRVLFYDPALSANGTTACASCHRQDLGFSDDTPLSLGFEGGSTGRNSMNLANVSYYARGMFFWDERADTLEDQVLMPIQDAIEMGRTLPELVETVAAQPYYPELFARAFGDPAIDETRIAWALAQYVRAIKSYRTPFDEGLSQTGNIGQDFPNFTTQENLGKQLFFSPAGNCAVCHVGNEGPPPPPGQAPPNEAIFQLTAPANNGLDLVTVGDQGAGAGEFRSPSLRNIGVSGPYMHDGRFDTLEQVVEHYDNGVQDHPNLDPRLRAPGGGPPQNLGLDPMQKAALVAFLRTLTDDALLADPKFSDPFRE